MFTYPIKAILTLSIFQLSIIYSAAQLLGNKKNFTHADTLRGSIGPGRMLWDVLHYEITVKPDYVNKTIEGKNTITFLDSGVSTMQLDLQEPMLIDSIESNGNRCTFSREGNVYWVKLRAGTVYGETGRTTLTVFFHGKPREAIRPPWDGGWIWKKDENGQPWMSVACQGLGASVWYPCKDIQSDEPDNGAILHIIVPDSLMGVGNGRLTEQHALPGGNTMYSWEVKNPINNYCIIPYIGKYVHFSEIFNGKKGKLDMDYWVLDYNLEKAKKQFKDAARMMKAFEYWFGPYPFYEDGYKLVEALHPGMEHQSAIAYGNGYHNGYRNGTISWSGTKWEQMSDYIIVHESGHEWFGNNITSKDLADMWIHESFTAYSEVLFAEYHFGKEAGTEYSIGTMKNNLNKQPIISPYGVNASGDLDIYFKGANMIHTIRQVINADKKFIKVLTGLNKTFYHQTVTSAQVENYISEKAGFNFSKIFDQYLRTIQVPVLEYKVENKTVSYKWSNTVDQFNLPIKVSFGKKEQWIKPTTEWQQSKPGKWYDEKTFLVNRNFYIRVKKIL